jgi:hypothetical protein
MRTRLVALVAGALLAGGGVLIPASAQAAGSAPRISAPAATAMAIELDSPAFPVGDAVQVSISGRVLDGRALSGTWSLTLSSAEGPSVLAANMPVNTANFLTGFSFRAGKAGDYGLTVAFTPSNLLAEQSSQAQTSFEVRIVGSTMTAAAPQLTAGTPGTLDTTIKLADSLPAGGTVRLILDGDDSGITCDPVPSGTQTVGCPLKLPASLTAGAHTAKLRWENSPNYAVAVATVQLTVAPPKKSSGGGSGSGSGGGAAPAPAPAAASASASPRATPKATATPIAAGAPAIDPHAADATGPIPLLPIIIAVIALLLCAAIVLTVVLVVRSRAPKPPAA